MEPPLNNSFTKSNFTFLIESEIDIAIKTRIFADLHFHWDSLNPRSKTHVLADFSSLFFRILIGPLFYTVTNAEAERLPSQVRIYNPRSCATVEWQSASNKVFSKIFIVKKKYSWDVKEAQAAFIMHAWTVYGYRFSCRVCILMRCKSNVKTDCENLLSWHFQFCCAVKIHLKFKSRPLNWQHQCQKYVFRLELLLSDNSTVW